MTAGNPEAAIVEAVGAWFRARGFRTFHEVEVCGTGHRFDLVATRGDFETHVVEAKVGFTEGLKTQAERAESYARNTWAAIRRVRGFPKRPEVPRFYASEGAPCGYGLLVVRPDDSIEVAWDPSPLLEWTREESVRACLTPFHEIEVGGTPVLPGERVLNFLRSRVLETHRRLWLTGRDRWYAQGEVFDLCKDLVEPYKQPLPALRRVLQDPAFLKRQERMAGRLRPVYQPSGDGVPEAARPTVDRFPGWRS